MFRPLSPRRLFPKHATTRSKKSDNERRGLSCSQPWMCASLLLVCSQPCHRCWRPWHGPLGLRCCSGYVVPSTGRQSLQRAAPWLQHQVAPPCFPHCQSSTCRWHHLLPLVVLSWVTTLPIITIATKKSDVAFASAGCSSPRRRPSLSQHHFIG